MEHNEADDMNYPAASARVQSLRSKIGTVYFNKAIMQIPTGSSRYAMIADVWENQFGVRVALVGITDDTSSITIGLDEFERCYAPLIPNPYEDTAAPAFVWWER